ncbi:SDR family oxidoreductase [Synechococcus sp. BA-132 BA5]|uniref:SDR family oxidoreductase n=1 Tax=Synechococcus sp. BA-132 BA5 TaxID=3110252 RepID=UPI002B20B97B|nr:SDR family oxidoreductase [Synechococcus sp. BA-132 BA5]MEA5415241.1 SDR family oxidoreductase [Synechococcus sp. BA-132 BA5]
MAIQYSAAEDDPDADARPKGAALITGAASGIGAAIAGKLAEDGWPVHVCDAAPDAVAEFASAHPDIDASVADVRDPQAAARVVAHAIAQHGSIGVLINNAGVAGMTAAIEDVDDDDWRRTIDININGAFYFLKAAAPAMKAAGGGAIINIASTAALFGYPQRTAYAASKWALIGMTKTLAMELGPFGVRVNAVCPGSVEGPRIDGVIERDAAHRGMAPEEVRRIYESQVSMRRFVTKNDIADTCAFLASDRARMISGQVISVDGHTETLTFPIK